MSDKRRDQFDICARNIVDAYNDVYADLEAALEVVERQEETIRELRDEVRSLQEQRDLE